MGLVMTSPPAGPVVSAKETVMGLIYKEPRSGELYMRVYGDFLARLSGPLPGYGYLDVRNLDCLLLRRVPDGTRLEVESTSSP